LMSYSSMYDDFKIVLAFVSVNQLLLIPLISFLLFPIISLLFPTVRGTPLVFSLAFPSLIWLVSILLSLPATGSAFYAIIALQSFMLLFPAMWVLPTIAVWSGTKLICFQCGRTSGGSYGLKATALICAATLALYALFYWEYYEFSRIC